MKKIHYILSMIILLGLFQVSCDSYRNVSADDGVYYTDEDLSRELAQNHEKQKQSDQKAYWIDRYKEKSDEGEYGNDETGENEENARYRETKENDYTTTNPDDLAYSSKYYEEEDDEDNDEVHVYVHHDYDYWYWYRPYWVRYYYVYPYPYSGVYVSFYYGPFYTYYDPWLDPWCYDPWYYTWYSPYYYGYYGYNYYGGYYAGYPYVMYNNTYINNYYGTRVSRVRGPRGYRPAVSNMNRIGLVATRNLRTRSEISRINTRGSLTDQTRNSRLPNVRNGRTMRHHGNDLRNVRNTRSTRDIRATRSTRHPDVRNTRNIRPANSDRIRNTRPVRSTRQGNGPVRSTRSGHTRTYRQSYLHNDHFTGSSHEVRNNDRLNHSTRSHKNRTRRSGISFFNRRNIYRRANIQPNTRRHIRTNRSSNPISRNTREHVKNIRTKFNRSSSYTPSYNSRSRSFSSGSGFSRSSSRGGSSSSSGRGGSSSRGGGRR